jgi:hypothetical protein
MAAALPYIGYALAAVSAAGAISSAQAQKQAGEDEKTAYNMRAAATLRQGAQEEDIARSKLAKLLASQRALYAKAGVDISSGSPLTVMADTASEGEKEALSIRFGAKEDARLQRFYGATASAAGRRQGTSTLITGLGAAGQSAFSTYKRTN